MKKCLYCYEIIENSELEYHSVCSKKLFSRAAPPALDIQLDDMKNLAKEVIQGRLVVTGVQPKISLGMNRERARVGSLPRLTLVRFGDGGWADYILKPPSDSYPHLPELEDASMKLAHLCKIPTAIHGLIRLKSGELAYLCRRFDRFKKTKIAVEDMCQLTGVLTERKYHSSMEKVGKAIKEFSSNPGNDLITLLDLSIFSFLIGNADMHLKNFSLMTGGDVSLSPAYDLLSTQLLLDDPDEFALPINGKKRKIKKIDFEIFAKTMGISELAIQKRFRHFKLCKPSMEQLIAKSFLPLELQQRQRDLINERFERLFGASDHIS